MLSSRDLSEFYYYLSICWLLGLVQITIDTGEKIAFSIHLVDKHLTFSKASNGHYIEWSHVEKGVVGTCEAL